MGHRRSGASTVVATVIVTALTLTLGTIAFFWASQTFAIQMGSAGVYFKNNSNSLLENLIIEDAWFNTTNKAWLTVRNVGTIEVRVVAIYINSTLQSNTSPSYGSSGIFVAVGRAVSIQVTTGFTWSSNQFVYISAVTSRGTVVRGYWSTGN
jgi:hypothetical protein